MTRADVDAPVPKPRITARGVAIAAGLWLLYTLLYAAIIARGAQIPFAYALIGQTLAHSILALYSVPVWLVVVRAMDEWGWGWKIAAHLALGPLYAWLGWQTYRALLILMANEAALREISAQEPWILLSNGTVYALQFALYHTIRAVQRLRLKQQQAAELMALAQERELAALKAQINPHFLFNTLNSISATVKAHPDEAREMIADLAGLLRHALDSARGGPLIPLRDELDFARAYLDLERRRFCDRLRVAYDVDEAALDTPVPPMVLQPLVENAVRHGIAPAEAGGTVTLRIGAPDGRLRVRVEDTGAGPPAEAAQERSGIGLATTNARLERLFGPEAALRTAPNEPRGFVAEFSIPRTEESPREEEKMSGRTRES